MFYVCMYVGKLPLLYTLIPYFLTNTDLFFDVHIVTLSL